jgi:hypothetical protein
MKYPLEKSATLMEEELGEENTVSCVKRTSTQRNLHLHYEEGTIVVALVQNHYSKVIQSLMHTVAFF